MELRLKTEELRKQEDKAKSLLKEKQLLEQKIARLERNKTSEVCCWLVIYNIAGC